MFLLKVGQSSPRAEQGRRPPGLLTRLPPHPVCQLPPGLSPAGSDFSSPSVCGGLLILFLPQGWPFSVCPLSTTTRQQLICAMEMSCARTCPWRIPRYTDGFLLPTHHPSPSSPPWAAPGVRAWRLNWPGGGGQGWELKMLALFTLLPDCGVGATLVAGPSPRASSLSDGRTEEGQMLGWEQCCGCGGRLWGLSDPLRQAERWAAASQSGSGPHMDRQIMGHPTVLERAPSWCPCKVGVSERPL